MHQLYPYQTEIAAAVIDSVNRNLGLTFSVEIARQGGKNELSAWLEMNLLLLFQDEAYNLVKCAPTFRPQAVISLRRLRDLLDDGGLGGSYRIENGHILRLGRARVIFLSAAETANVVGNTAHLLLEIDEAQDVDIDKFNRDFKPMAAVANATTVLYGTPWHEYTLLEEAKKTNLELESRDGFRRHFRYDWLDVARHRPHYRDYVANEQERLGENHPVFRTQYALLPVSGGRGLFTDEQLMNLSGAHPACRLPLEGRVYVGGLDFGGDASAAADATVLTLAELDHSHTSAGGSAPHIRVVRHYAWQGLPAAVLVKRITEIARAWKLRRLAADATGLGQPLAGMLKDTLGNRVVSFVFNRKNKSELGYELLAAANTGRLKLYARDASPECVECWSQLEAAEADYRPDRTLNFYVNPARGRDDYLTSLALTLKAAESCRPRTAFGVKHNPKSH